MELEHTNWTEAKLEKKKILKKQLKLHFILICLSVLSRKMCGNLLKLVQSLKYIQVKIGLFDQVKNK